ncbi:alpha/beta hydrolase [Streptomyces sp. NPDC005890]|uniref:alpha/beta fold hydrolase n=1 Tax=Streptomyces sp. NPDC005890 TaxID=3154568 RepID=UPI0034099849
MRLPLPEPRRPTADVHHDRAGRARVRSFGTLRLQGRRHLVVLVPGLGAPGYLLSTADRCARSGPVRVLDVPGFEDPLGPACAVTLGSLADTVSRWLAEVAPAPVVLAGHSTGAQVALHAAARRPDRVAALVLLAPTFPPHLRRTGPLVRAFARTALHESPGVLPAVLPAYLKAGPRRLTACVRSAQSDAPEQLMPAVHCPVTVAVGERDALSPLHWADGLASRTSHGRVVLVPGAHSFPHTSPGITAVVLEQAGTGLP